MKRSAVGRSKSCSTWVPSWVSGLGTAVWISNPDGNINYFNRRAENLFGFPASECIGLPCHCVIVGRDASGRPFCRANCPIRCRAQDDREIEPIRLRVTDRDRKDRQIQVLTIAVTAADHNGPWLVHVVTDHERTDRIERYLNKVLSRTPYSTISSNLQSFTLTRREKQILRLLAEDETPYSIAASLYVSRATVRNHIQHILVKLDVHSTMEAVAYYLLVGDKTDS